MRTDQFRDLLRRCRLLPNSKHTARALGLSLRQLQRIAADTTPVPRPVALLLIAYAKRGGAPSPLWDPDRDTAGAFSEAMAETIKLFEPRERSGKGTG